MVLLLAIRFLVELIGVVALGVVGATVPSAPLWRVVLGIGAPLALIVAWSLVVAPKADNPLPPRVRELLGTALLVGVGVVLARAGHAWWGMALALTVLADQALLLVAHPDGAAASLAATARRGGE